MTVNVTCRKCGTSKRMDVGSPAPGQTMEEHLHLVQERLMHRPSFQCFGGHFELKPPVPGFWDVDWGSLAEE